MLTPTKTTATTAMAMRFAGVGAQRAALTAPSPFAAKSGKTMTCPQRCLAANARNAFTAPQSTRPFSILASSIPRAAFRQTSPASTASSPVARIIVTTTHRAAFFSASAAPSSSSSSSSASTGAAGENQKLDWNTFFKLRKNRRRWQLIFSVAMLGVSGTVGAGALATGVAEPLVSQVPLDPFVTLGLMVMGFAALGWLAGPSIGSAVFNAINRRWKKQMTFKEIEFFGRIKKNRVDPSASGASNPVPDFYGENISSVAGYRQWLKDQRAFNKKRTRFV